MLDLSTQSEAEIYQAWEKEHFSEISDFKPEGLDEKVSLQMNDYIETLPSALILQLNRTKFNSEGKMEKLYHKVHIPLELHPARYLLQHKGDLEAKRLKVRETKKEIERLRAQLAEYKKPHYDIDLLDLVQNMSKFVAN
jgi:uncharacterized UBP type Zn finger protein